MATAVLIPLTPVESGRLSAIGYDADTFTLAIRFPPTKKSPAGKVYHYANVSEEKYDDFVNAESKGVWFGENILNNPAHPYVCVDEGLGEAIVSEAAPTSNLAVAEPVAQVEVPDDEAGLKALAMSTSANASMLAITCAEECELAMKETLRIRSERKLVMAKIEKNKKLAYDAWKAQSDFYNEVDSRYADAEKFLDDGILAYRAAEKKRVDEENARLRREQEARDAEARRLQQEEFEKAQREAQEEADRQAKLLAEADAKAAEAQGAPAEVVEQILSNPLPVAVRHVAPMPVMRTAPAPLATVEVPKVAGMGFTQKVCWEVTDEDLVPVTREFYSRDEKKINAKVQAMKLHANIPGVRVWIEEVPVKRTASRK